MTVITTTAAAKAAIESYDNKLVTWAALVAAADRPVGLISPAYDHGYRNVPITQLDQLGRWCRMRDARDQRKFRLGMECLMATIRQKHLTPK